MNQTVRPEDELWLLDNNQPPSLTLRPLCTVSWSLAVCTVSAWLLRAAGPVLHVHPPLCVHCYINGSFHITWARADSQETLPALMWHLAAPVKRSLFSWLKKQTQHNSYCLLCLYVADPATCPASGPYFPLRTAGWLVDRVCVITSSIM